MSDCLDRGDGPCAGETFERYSLTGASTFYRCDAHYDTYVERTQPRLDEVNARYPDSPFPPSWFDPTACGEAWDSDY